MFHARTKSARAQVIGLLLFLVVGKVHDGLRIGGEKMRLNEVDRARSFDGGVSSQKRQPPAAAQPIQKAPFELSANLVFGAVAER